MLYYNRSNVESQNLESQNLESRNLESRNLESRNLENEIKNLRETVSLLKKSKRVDYNLISDVFLPSETNEILQRILIILYIIFIMVFVKFFIIK